MDTLRKSTDPNIRQHEAGLLNNLGSALDGVSDEVLQLADGFVNIPMFGFVESYNLSVSAAICLHSLRTKLMHIPKSEWQLTHHECLELKKDWMIKSIQQGKRVWQRYLKTKGG